MGQLFKRSAEQGILLAAEVEKAASPTLWNWDSGTERRPGSWGTVLQPTVCKHTANGSPNAIKLEYHCFILCCRHYRHRTYIMQNCHSTVIQRYSLWRGFLDWFLLGSLPSGQQPDNNLHCSVMATALYLYVCLCFSSRCSHRDGVWRETRQFSTSPPQPLWPWWGRGCSQGGQDTSAPGWDSLAPSSGKHRETHPPALNSPYDCCNAFMWTEWMYFKTSKPPLVYSE